MTKIFLLLLAFVFLLSACVSPVAESPKYCVQDSDCVCGGIDKLTNDCFVGSKNYFESGSVDVSKDCPDFCTGIGANLVTKCVDNVCMNVNKNTFPECSADSDCVPSDCCHASGCVSKSSAKNCAGVFCTQNCVAGSLDCGGSCACESRRCVAKNLFVQQDDVPVI